MTKKYKMLSRALMLLPAMLFLVVATPALSQERAAQCPTGYADCDGNKQNKCETNIQNNVNACGACGKVCSFPNATSACVNGSCQVSACSAGYGNCDGTPSNGCETDLKTNVNNCGACGKVCSLPNATCSCESGSCAIATCSATSRDCDGLANNGCEANVTADARNCGECGNTCYVANGTGGCAGGRCVIQSCNQGFNDCDLQYANGCECRQ